MAIRRSYAERVIEPDDEPTQVVETPTRGRRSRRVAIGLMVGLLAWGAGAAVSQLAGSKPAEHGVINSRAQSGRYSGCGYVFY